MRIALGCDHAGHEYKERIKQHLISKGYEVSDHGTHGSESVDYPDFVHPVSKDLSDNHAELGVLICGSGNGVAITANKYEKVRCGLSWNTEVAKLIRLHNNANAIAIPARFVDVSVALEMLDTFLETKFEGGRHQRRVDKMTSNMNYSC